jgi:hypothetical protein
MQLARAYSDHLTVIAACRLTFEDDFVDANHDVTEQQDAPDTADHSPQRRDGKNTAFPPSYSKRRVLQISVEARADPYSSPAPPSASGAKPGNASNAIFMLSSRPEAALRCVTASPMRFNGARKMSGAFACTSDVQLRLRHRLCGASRDDDDSGR